MYTADFGKTADDYATHRAGFPPRLFDLLEARGVLTAGARALDIGTGTGTLARGMAARGLVVLGQDVAEESLDQATRLAAEEGLIDIRFAPGSAEETGQPDGAYDLVTAGQCWHWFDGPAAFAEVWRVLKPGGALVICHFDWLPIPGTPVAATEAMIVDHAPDWPFAQGTGIYPRWTTGMAVAGFEEIETVSFDHKQLYSHAAWRGRIRASAPIGGSMSTEEVTAFDEKHAAMLARNFPEDPLICLHRCWAAIARKPA